MSGRISAHSAQRLVKAYINEIEKAAEKIQQNFEDMDLENASVRDDLKEVINKMRSECRRTIDQLNSYHFS